MPDVEDKVRHAQALRAAVAKDQMHPAWLDALQCRKNIGIDGELDDVADFWLHRQLGVNDFVTEVAEVRRTWSPDQEIRIPAPATVEQRRLIDGIGPFPHGRSMARARLPAASAAAIGTPLASSAATSARPGGLS